MNSVETLVIHYCKVSKAKNILLSPPLETNRGKRNSSKNTELQIPTTYPPLC